MSWEFRPGMEVVAVITIEHKGVPGAQIVRGQIYKIREIVECPEERKLGIALEGMELPTHPRIGVEFCWTFKRFRPLRKRATDISIFKSLLTPSHQKEEVS